jgi:predicted transcriptional regulator of viral defense system
MPTRLQIAKKDIVNLFENSTRKIFDNSAIEKILDENRNSWRLTQSITTSEFVSFLLDNKLEKVRFDFPSRPIIRYTWGNVPFYELLLQLKPNCYFSHYTAVYFHDLTEQIPKTIYINEEQSTKPRLSTTLKQFAIDIAFKKPTRLSNNITEFKDYKVQLLNGKYTGNAGVINTTTPDGENVLATNIERTLLDITVRPEYAGGVFEVLKAYRLAKNKVSVNKLCALLKKLDYLYPYHQAIGFYLQKAGGYSDRLSLLKKFEIKYDFYLAHRMGQCDYSSEWRLFYPKGF